MLLQSDLAFLEPNDREFRYLEARAVGRNAAGAILEWKLDARTPTLTLSNTLGLSLEVGVVSKVVVRCSLAFLRYTTPFVVLEYNDHSRAIFTIDLNDENPSLKSLDVDLSSYCDITLTYWRSAHKDKLIVTAIGLEGIYSGTLDELGNLEIEIFNKIDAVNEYKIHRVGVNTANQFQTELVQVAVHQ